MACSSTTQMKQQWKHDVFLSFRGEDTRSSFTSHLHAALCRYGINTFIDNKISRGDEITTALMEVIEESRIAVIVFSKDYASSTFCLDELAKIIECNETYGQMLLPIFYCLDPSDVKNQTGSFQNAFAKYEIDHKFDKVHRWRTALTKVACMAGWDSNDFRSESQLVDEIAKNIFRKLKQTCPRDLDQQLVGINSRIDEIKALLSLESLDVRILGIWGMGGIGKTTIAEAIFNHIACQFEACCFLENVRENFEKNGGLTYLIKEFLCQTLGERDVNINPLDMQCSLVRRMFKQKILIVIDDVNSSQQLQPFVKRLHCFGVGSRIIIVSRDKQMLLESDAIYEVKELSDHEALQLFIQYAKSFPTEDLCLPSYSVIKYANGNPLALKVLGSFLAGKSKREWENAVDKLKKFPNKDVQNVLKVSYDSLDREEKDIFLHLACFFRGERRDKVTQILEDCCGFSMDIGLRVLMDKSLISIPDNSKILMHDLLQEMGKEIVRQESTDPGKWSRLWNSEDIVHVLTKNTGSKATEAIFFDMSTIDEIDLKANVFARMSNLKVLKFYFRNFHVKIKDKVHLSRGLESLPNELRYFHWEGFPLKTLPANFCPMHLVELHLTCSKLKRLSKRTMDLKKLKKIDLSCSRRLIKIPELSQSTNLTSIVLFGCKRIRSFPSTIGLKSLENLNLSNCFKLERFPEVSSNIRWLYLSKTAIKEVPSSVEHLCRLKKFTMNDCIKLESLPNSICKLKSLACFSLSGCSNLKNFPEILEPMDRLSQLRLNGTAIREIRLPIENLKGLFWLDMENCRNLACLPESICNLTYLDHLNVSDCPKLEKLPKELIVYDLDVSDCPKLEKLPKILIIGSGLNASGCHLSKLPCDLSSWSSISSLSLRENKFQTLPGSIKLLSQLRSLDISLCHRLQSLPDLPLSLECLNAHDCTSLATLSGFKQLFKLDPYNQKILTFTNCYKMDPNVWSDVLETIQHSVILCNMPGFRNKKRVSKQPHLSIPEESCMSFWYPGSEIPEWFTYKSMGDSIEIPLSTGHSNNCSLMGYALCFVLAFSDNFFEMDYRSSTIKCTSGYSSSCVDIGGFFGGFSLKQRDKLINIGSEHVVLCCNPNFLVRTYNDFIVPPCQDCGKFALFKFYPMFKGCSWRLKKCGVLPLYACDEECNVLRVEKSMIAAQGTRENKRQRDDCIEDENEVMSLCGWRSSEGEEEEEPSSKRLRNDKSI